MAGQNGIYLDTSASSLPPLPPPPPPPPRPLSPRRTSFFNALCNYCCCCRCSKPLRHTRVAPLSLTGGLRLPAFDDDNAASTATDLPYEMVETRANRRIRVIHLLARESLGKCRTAKATSNTRNGSGGFVEKNGNHSGASFGQENFSRRSTRSQCPVMNAQQLVVNVEINGSSRYVGEADQDIEGIEPDNASILDDELAMYDQMDIADNELSRSKHNSIQVYDFESAFHPNNRSIHLAREDDRQQKLQLYGNWLAQNIVVSALQIVCRKYNRTMMHVSEQRIEFRNGQAAHYFNSVVDTCVASGTTNLEDGCRERCYNNQGYQGEFDASDGGIDALRCQEKSASNNATAVATNFASSGFHSLSKRFIGSGIVESGIGIGIGAAGEDNLHSTNNLNPFENFTYSPSGCCDDASSQVGSSFQSSTWGSSTNSSLRYVRRFVSKKYKTKPMLFFIHGIGESADLWRNQLRFFRHKGYETLAMDLVGHGLSYAPDKPKVYLFHNILADVIAIFDRYSRERNVAVGHSYGACFAAALARHRSKQVTHLVLLSGGGPFPLCPQVTKKKWVPFCFAGCVRWWDTSCKSRRRAYHMPSRKQTRFVSSLEIPSYVRRYIFKGQMWLEGDASFHKQIAVPTLLVYGLRDPFITLVEECEMEKTIPRAFLELIPEAGHMLMLDTPHEVNDMIYKFLRRWDR